MKTTKNKFGQKMAGFYIQLPVEVAENLKKICKIRQITQAKLVCELASKAIAEYIEKI